MKLLELREDLEVDPVRIFLENFAPSIADSVRAALRSFQQTRA